jgi:tetratricopeptide (TPR) repeat protein
MLPSRRAVGRLDDPGGRPLGTGFAVSPEWALTAFHCVGDRHAAPPVLRHGDVRLAVGGQSFDAVVSDYDPRLDIALLRLSEELPPEIRPITLSCEVTVGSRFEAFGYPEAAEDAELEGWPVGGSVTSVLMRLRDGAPVIAVSAEGLDHQLPLQGISGAPVLVGQDSQLAAGVLRYSVLADEQTGVALGNTLFATPASAVAERFPVLRPYLLVPERERERRASLGSLLRIDLGVGGLLPALATTDLYALGIPRSAPVVAGAPDQYVERTADGEIRKALGEKRFVIIKGAAKSGKSRTAYEAVRALYPESSLIAPRQQRRALARIVEEDLLQEDPGRLVIWLDELAGFLSPTEGIDRRLIDQLLVRYPQALIVGTIVGEDLSRLRSGDDLTRTTREVLEVATEVILPTVPTQEERLRASELYPGEDFGGTAGIAERLVAAPELIKRFDDAENHAGWCLVIAAVDWWRMGSTSPAPESMLRALAGHYRDVFFPNLELSDDEVRTGLNWAEKPVGSSEALLNVADRIPERTYRPFDPLRAHASKRSDTAMILAPCWETAITLATPRDLISIAIGAIDAGQKRETAKRALHMTLNSDDYQSASWAALFLGELEAGDENTEVAYELLTQAAHADDEKIAMLATIDLGVALTNAGELGQARELLETAAASGHAEIVPLAQASLGALLSNVGEPERGRELLEAAIATGNPEALPLAQRGMGVALMNAGELGRARELLEGALASGNPQVVPLAQVDLGILLMYAGELGRARKLLEAAAGSKNPLVGPIARANLGALLAQFGELAQGLELLEAEARSGDPRVVPLAQAGLGVALMNAGELGQAREWLEAAAASRDPQTAQRAKVSLGALLMNAGELGQARELLEAAAGSRYVQVASLAQVNLGGLLLMQGKDVESAQELLVAALASGNPQVVPQASHLLGLLLAGQGDSAGAQAAFQAAIATGHPYWAGIARVNLAATLMRDEDAGRARELLEAAMASGDPQVVPLAQANLGGLLLNAGEPARARELLEAALASGDPQVVPLASHLLASVLSEEGDLTGTGCLPSDN